MRNQTPQSEPNRTFPIIDFIISIFLSAVSLTWFISGKIILPNKGVFLQGTQARCAASLLLVFALAPVLSRIRNRIKNMKRKEHETNFRKAAIFRKKT